MAILLKPRSNKEGVVETTADLAQLNGRPEYQVLVKDVGIFEWIGSGEVDDNNIFLGANGFWSRVIQSGEGVNIGFVPENVANKSVSVTADGASDTKYPSVKASKDYADSLIVGLLNDRGNFTPSVSSPGGWPTTGGSGTAGAIKKGDIWFCAADGFLGTTAVVTGASFRALTDAPGQTAGNWNILNSGLGYTPENVANKSTSTALGTSNTLYPTQNAVKAYIDANAGLPYKVYTASFLISGTGVSSLTVFRNTIGDGSGDGINDIAWSGDGVNCNANMTGSTAFPSGKTWVQSAPYTSGGVSYGFYGRRMSNTQVRYSSILTSNNSQGAGSTASVFIEIRVYP
jgi:hypothetical protein